MGIVIDGKMIPTIPLNPERIEWRMSVPFRPATNVPFPLIRTTRFSSLMTASACFDVIWLTLKYSASSFSDGTRSPGFSFPDKICSRKWFAICRYSGTDFIPRARRSSSGGTVR